MEGVFEALAALAQAAAKKGQTSTQASEAGADPRYARIIAALQQRGAVAAAPQPAATEAAAPAAPSAPVIQPTPAQADAQPALLLTPHPEHRGGRALQGLFKDGNSLLRAVVAAELLSPPLALRESARWEIRTPKPE